MEHELQRPATGPNLLDRFLVFVAAATLGWVAISILAALYGATSRQIAIMCSAAISGMAIYAGISTVLLGIRDGITAFYAEKAGRDRPNNSELQRTVRIVAALQLFISVGASAIGIWIYLQTV
jgi:hypothetical protein